MSDLTRPIDPPSPFGDGDHPPDVTQRDPATGRFAPGNRLGRGNPHAAQVAALRSAMMEAVTPDDIKVMVGNLVRWARNGSLEATKVLLDRLIGKPVAAVDLTVEAAPPAPVAIDEATRRTMVALLEDPASREVLIRVSEREARRRIEDGR